MKRTLALMLCLLLMGYAALADTYPVDCYGAEESLDFGLLLRDDGTPLIPAETYGSIYEITPEGMPDEEKLFSVTPLTPDLEYTPELAEEILYDVGYTRVALLDGSGRQLTGFDYDWLDYTNGYVVFTLPGETPAVGNMDTTGRVVIEPDYAMVKAVGEGRWLAMLNPTDDSAIRRIETGDGDYYEETVYPLAIIESDGSVRELGLHSADRYFNMGADGVSVFWSVEEYGGQSVYLDPNGEVLFGRGFQYADPFAGDFAVVEENDRYGVIDRTGAYVVRPEYDYIDATAGKPTIARRGAAFAAYDPDTMALLTEMDFAPATDVEVVAVARDLLGVTVDGQTRLYNGSGELLMEVPGDVTVQLYGYTGEGITRLVAETGDWPDDVYRLIDLQGNPVSSDYRMINQGSWQDGHGRFITGDFEIYEDSEGSHLIDWSSYRYGLIDEDGAALLEPIYDELRVLSFDRYWAVAGDRSGLIDALGNWYYTVSSYEALMD